MKNFNRVLKWISIFIMVSIVIIGLIPIFKSFYEIINSPISSVQAQGNNSVPFVNKVLVTNDVSGAYIGTAGTGPNSIPNLGQIGHQALIRFSSIPAHVCANPNWNAQLQASANNTNWQVIPVQSPLVDVNNNTTIAGMITAYGNYPFTRIIVNWVDNTNCQLTIFYTGISTIPPNLQTQSPTVQLTTTNVSVTAGNTQTVITTNFRYFITSMVLNVNTLNTSITLTDGTGAGCAGPSTLALFQNLIAGQTITFPPGLYGVIIRSPGTAGNSFCITAATGTVTGYVTWFGSALNVIGGVYQ